MDFHQFAFEKKVQTVRTQDCLFEFPAWHLEKQFGWGFLKTIFFLQFSDKDKVSIFDGNDGHWINLSDIQSGRKLAEIVTLLTLTLNWHPANIHLHFMKNWTKMKKENSFKYWNKNCLLLLSYKRYPTVLIRVPILVVSKVEGIYMSHILSLSIVGLIYSEKVMILLAAN